MTRALLTTNGSRVMGTCRALVVFVRAQFASGIHFEIQAPKTEDLPVGEGDGPEAILCPLGVELKTTEGWVSFGRMPVGLISRERHFDLVGRMCAYHPLPGDQLSEFHAAVLSGDNYLFGTDGQGRSRVRTKTH